MNKLFDVFAEIKRQAKGDHTRITESELPRLWILYHVRLNTCHYERSDSEVK